MYKYYIFILFFIMNTSAAVSGMESMNDDELTDGAAGIPWLDVDIIDRITLRYYYLDSDYPSFRYPLENSYGDRIKQGITPFLNIEGKATAFDRLSLYYNFQADLTDRIELNRASISYRYGPVAFEAARGTVWMGHGYYGSLLLSNNADAFSLVRIGIEEPVEVPYIGSIQYMLFNGWPKNFNIVGHRLTWFPLPWIELGGNKTVIYTQGEKLYNAPFRLFKDTAGAGTDHFRDARASLDIAVHLPFLREYLYPLVDGKIYFEYGGEDIHSFWTSNNGNWLGPLGFDFVGAGTIAGIWLSTERDEIRVEYAQNYRNIGLFSRYAGRAGWGEFSIPWYGIYDKMHFVNNGNIMGHHMGSQADIAFFEYTRSFDSGHFTLRYSNRRRGLIEHQLPRELSEHPEVKSQYGIEVSRSVWLFDVTALFLWNRYENVDRDRSPLMVNPIPGRDAEEYIFGITVVYVIGR